jgi:hypothetical protein
LTLFFFAADDVSLLHYADSFTATPPPTPFTSPLYARCRHARRAMRRHAAVFADAMPRMRAAASFTPCYFRLLLLMKSDKRAMPTFLLLMPPALSLRCRHAAAAA